MLIRRSEYNPDQYLWEKEFILAGRKYKRLDLEASTETIYRGFFCLLFADGKFDGNYEHLC